jgi:hypothetical protein
MTCQSELKGRDVIDIYEEGKHRRYALMFSVNGGAFAIGKLLTGEPGRPGVVVGGMKLWHLAIAMIFFTAVMACDIAAFGSRMKLLNKDLFDIPGKVVLALLSIFLGFGWLIVGFG